MDDRVDAFGHCAHRVIIQEGALNEIDAETGKVLSAAGAEVVENPNLDVTGLQQVAGEIGADEPGTARDQYLGHSDPASFLMTTEARRICPA